MIPNCTLTSRDILANSLFDQNERDQWGFHRGRWRLLTSLRRARVAFETCTLHSLFASNSLARSNCNRPINLRGLSE